MKMCQENLKIIKMSSRIVHYNDFNILQNIGSHITYSYVIVMYNCYNNDTTIIVHVPNITNYDNPTFTRTLTHWPLTHRTLDYLCNIAQKQYTTLPRQTHHLRKHYTHRHTIIHNHTHTLYLLQGHKITQNHTNPHHYTNNYYTTHQANTQ